MIKRRRRRRHVQDEKENMREVEWSVERRRRQCRYKKIAGGCCEEVAISNQDVDSADMLSWWSRQRRIRRHLSEKKNMLCCYCVS